MSEDRAQGSLLVSSLQHRSLPAFGRKRRSGEKRIAMPRRTYILEPMSALILKMTSNLS